MVFRSSVMPIALAVLAISSVGRAANPSLPVQADGLWESESETGIQVCIGSELPRTSALVGYYQGTSCNWTALPAEAGESYRYETSCVVGDQLSTIGTTVVTGDVSTRFQVHTSSTATGSLSDIIPEQSNSAWRRLGPCAPGQSPGDVISGGQSVGNLKLLLTRPES